MIKHRKKTAIIGVSIVIFAVVVFFLTKDNSTEQSDTAKCELGVFETTVSSVGEVQAVSSLDINIPDALVQREIRVQSIKILDMIAEGTMVKKGDYVASLDPGDVENELKRVSENLEQQMNTREEAKLDSSLRLSSLRADLRNTKDGLSDRQLKVEQSIYESKAFQRQAQIELEKAQRLLDQKTRNYQKQVRRHELIIERIDNDINNTKKRLDLLNDLKAGLRIKAPADGMLLYGKSWRGTKIRVGDEVGRFMPLIATLPDLSKLVSEAFVQEVDIKHIKNGQKVRIAIDAFPEQKFAGTITSVANIGQKMPGKEMNGFKVTIAIEPTVEKLLPGMTTNNTIITGVWDNALILPRPAVFGNDSLQYVFIKNAFKTVKQQVITAGENETHFMVTQGLEKGDKVMLQKPNNADALHLELVKMSN